jgi:RimJ/RimL family protein N-acetyltransferase
MADAAFTFLDGPRVRLRRFGDADLAEFVRYRSDPEVARYQSWSPSYSREEGLSFLASQKAIHPDMAGTWFQFAVEVKATGALAGDCAFCAHEDEPRTGEIGFTFARGHQGHGYASEAVARLLQYAFETLQKHRIVAITDTKNARSIVLLERLGMRREAHFRQNVWFKGGWGDEYLYAMLRDEWRIPLLPSAARTA